MTSISIEGMSAHRHYSDLRLRKTPRRIASATKHADSSFVFNPAGCETDQFACGVKTQFFLAVRAVRFDGLDGSVEFFCNLPGAKSETGQPQNFELLICKAGERIGTPGTGGRYAKAFQNKAVHVIALIYAAIQDSANGRQDIFYRLVFHDVTLCTQPQASSTKRAF